MRVPSEAALGLAHATLSFPGLDGFNIVPAVIEINIEGQSWLGWTRHYGPWGLAGLALAGVAWCVMRKKRARTLS